MDIIQGRKSVCWLGDSREQVSAFPEIARQRAGLELWEVQKGNDPSDYKPMPSVGIGVARIPEEVAEDGERGCRVGGEALQGPVTGEEASMSGKSIITRSSGNVFEDVGFPRAEAENLLLRAELMSRVRELARNATQREAAAQFGVSQPRLNDLLKGKIEKFSLDALVNMLARAGMRVEMRVRAALPEDEALRLAVAETRPVRRQRIRMSGRKAA